MAGEDSKNPMALLDGTADCACLNLRMAARAVTQMYDEALKPSGLKATQFSVLAAVATVGPASMTKIAGALVMDRTTLTRNLQPLLDRKLVEADKAPTGKAPRGKAKDGKAIDGRERTIAATLEGRNTLARALPLWKSAQDHIIGGLGFARWRGIARLLSETIDLTR